MISRIAMSLTASLAILGWTPSLCADLSSPLSSFVADSDFAINVACPPTAGDWQGAADAAGPGASRLPFAPATTIPGLSFDFPADRLSLFMPLDLGRTDLSSPEVKEFPPAPSSAALFLSAALSAGAWRLGRSARQLHLSHLPDWYHTGGARQVGYAVPFDLDFSGQPLIVFKPVDNQVGEHHFSRRPARETQPHGDAQCFLLITAPRGPPLLSS